MIQRSGGGARARLCRAMSSARHGRFAASVALVATVLSPAAGAAAAPRQTTVRASANASVDVAFARPFALDSEQATVSGGRRYAGFYLHPVGKPAAHGTGVVYLHAYRERRFAWHALPIGYADLTADPPRTVPAGRYRLYVLGDGPVEVRLPLAGYAGRTLRATRPAAVAYAVKDVTTLVLPVGAAGVAAPGAGQFQLPITVVSDRTISFTTSQLITRGSGYTTTNSTPSCIGAAEHPACVTEEKEGDGGLHSRGEFHVDSSPLRSGVFLHNYGRYYFPGQLAGGEQTAHFGLAAANTIERATIAAMSIAV